jgi:hypothetical protein
MPVDTSDTRRSVYLLITAVAVSIAVAKVVGAENLFEPSRYTPPISGGYSSNPPDPPRIWPPERPDPMPMFSSNDKSRWATVRALVDKQTYVIGKRELLDPDEPKSYRDSGIIWEPGFRSLDIVMNPETREFYSSKPPLFATMLAGEYWVLKRTLDWDIVRDRWLVIPTILLTINVLPFAIYLLLLARLIEATGKTDFGKLVAFIAAALGTYLLTFSGTLNNHLPAAYCVLFAIYPIVRAFAEDRMMTPRGYLCCGFFAAMAATFELPALALLVALGLPLLMARAQPTLLFFVPGALIPLIALFACNYAALGSLQPPYTQFGGPWYNFEGSHWAKWGTPAAKGIDFNTEPTKIYAFHLLFGHHGWFSLTPINLLALGGLIGLGVRSASDVEKLFQGKSSGSGWTPELFAAMTFVVSAVVFAFYLTRTQSYNYGGFTSGPRWLFWLIPLWVLAIPPAVDRLAGMKAGRFFCAALLGFSVLSIFYPSANPWRHPWILNLMEFTGYIRY